MKILPSLFIFCLSLTPIYSQKKPAAVAINRIDPTNWWIGMHNPNLQLLVYGPGVGTLNFTLNYPGVTLVKVNKVENPNYAFLDLAIASSAKPGLLKLVGQSGKQSATYSYELKSRNKDLRGAGVTSSDLIYLIMPDRFANGDPTNDKLAKLDPAVDRANPFLRHGGDLKGITDHLDYFQELGVTTLWLTPIIENDELQKKEGHGGMQAGYHGYHFTDHYQIDKRFGGNQGYVKFSEEVHKRGMKVVQDAVYNHVSDDHWMFKDKPTPDWFNNWPSYTGSSHKEHPLFDPHAAEIDRKVLLDGWFTPFLPDVNQRNPFFANYLIQHAIWSTETFNVDAWRIDTYKYNDQEFMNRCNQALMNEYPAIHLFGESLMAGPLNVSYFVRNNINFPFKSNLPGTLDFPINFAITDALRQKFGWDEGVNRLYSTLALDFVYQDPTKNVTSLDNHDLDRYFSVIGDDIDKYKIGVTWLLTLRGIPSWYYGTEILMKNFKNPTDAEVRRDFPGGFQGDVENKFVSSGRNDKENDAFNYVKKLSTYRKNTTALQSGKLMQYLPVEGVYVYFRYDETKTIMVVANSMDKNMDLTTSRFNERMSGFTNGTNVMTGQKTENLSSIILLPKSILVLELGR